MFAQKLMCSLTLRMYMHALFFPPAWSHEFLWNEHKVWKCKHLPAEEKWINSRLKEIVFSLKVNETKRERMRPDNSCWQTNGVYIMHPSRLYSFHKFWGIFFFKHVYYLCCCDFIVPHLVFIFCQNMYCLFLNRAEWMKCMGFNKRSDIFNCIDCTVYTVYCQCHWKTILKTTVVESWSWAS